MIVILTMETIICSEFVTGKTHKDIFVGIRWIKKELKVVKKRKKQC